MASPDPKAAPTPAQTPMTIPPRVRRRLMVDKMVRWLVMGGGALIIFCIVAIFFVIGSEALHLFKGASAQARKPIELKQAAAPLAVGIDEYQEWIYWISADGLKFYKASDGSESDIKSPLDLKGAKITACADSGHNTYVLGLSDGKMVSIKVSFLSNFSDGGLSRVIVPQITADAPMDAGVNGKPIRTLASKLTSTGPVYVASTGARDVSLITVEEKHNLLTDETTREASAKALKPSWDGNVSALEVDENGRSLFVGTEKGEIGLMMLQDEKNAYYPAPPEDLKAGTAISSMSYLLGDRTLVTGSSEGRVTSWMINKNNTTNALSVVKVHDFQAHKGSITAVTPSHRNKSFLTASTNGEVKLHYATNGRTLLELSATGGDLKSLVYSPKGDGVITANAKGAVQSWTLENEHPEVSWDAIFGKLVYEGYPKAEYVWQSTSGSDDFEPKFSLTPLIVGTLKGTLYALMFAVPLALLSALYVSQFMHPAWRAYIKPTVEIMAALPSVVLGFLAGLWLAPVVEKVAPSVLLSIITIPICILLALVVWKTLPVRITKQWRAGSEILLILPVIVLGWFISQAMGGWFEHTFLGGDYRIYLGKMGVTFDQRNSLVVGLAMGFAVIPIIFTIAEDALANVPQQLRAGSLALGATPWQTAVRVILPTASPGLFSAVMIGFGRAVGETMIVLMATGNTPVMDLSMFNGFRALSANIAVELPEAAQYSTHYRMLFLAALLLFFMTFAVNTAAEMIRLRLRKKYRVL